MSSVQSELLVHKQQVEVLSTSSSSESDALRQQLSELSAQLAEKDTAMSSVQSELQKHASDLSHQHVLVSDLEARVSFLSSEKERLSNELVIASTNVSGSFANLDELNIQLRARDSSILSLHEQLSDLQANFSFSECQRVQLEAQRKEIVQSKEELLASIHAKQEALVILQRESQNTENELKGKIEQVEPHFAIPFLNLNLFR